MKILMVSIIVVSIAGVLIFWKRDQNKVFALLMFSLLFLFGSTVYFDYSQEWKDYQSEYYRLAAEKESDPKVKASVLNTSLEIKQIWNPGLDVADRCTTCHLGYNNPVMTDAPKPFRFHSAAREHDFDDIGCVICHQGQGRATTVRHAHAEHEKFWETPVLPMEMAQAACSKCHDKTELNGGDVVTRGKQLFIKMGCHGCHKLKGYEKLYKVATSLKGAAHKLNPSWMVKWIKNPQQYLANTKMPNFRFSEDEAVSIAAYLLSQTSDNLRPQKRAGKGDPKKGKKLIKKVGCLGCHAISGEGASFASDLGKLATKVNRNWLVNWILDPKSYAPRTLMPKFRLSIEEANDIAAYLMMLGTPPEKFKYQGEIKSRERISRGKDIIQQRGCIGCHDINGIAPGRVGPGLSKIGAKDSHHLDFGNNHEVEHNWESWVQHKIKNPTSYDTEAIKANMPTFSLADEDIVALSVFLKGFDGKSVPSSFVQKLTPKDFEIEQGRNVIAKYNCRGCHIVEGKGGKIARFYKGTFNAPPPLETNTLHVGERIKDGWLYSFLRQPTPVRKWLKVRMPTFQFSQEEIYYLTRMFVNFGAEHVPYEEGIREGVSDETLIQGRKLVLAFACLECHDGSRGPTFDVVNRRVRGDWAKGWLKKTREIYPGTKMPEHWPVKKGKRVVASKFPEARKMLGGDVDRQIDTIVTYLANYDKKPFLEIELPEEDDDEDE